MYWAHACHFAVFIQRTPTGGDAREGRRHPVTGVEADVQLQEEGLTTRGVSLELNTRGLDE